MDNQDESRRGTACVGAAIGAFAPHEICRPDKQAVKKINGRWAIAILFFLGTVGDGDRTMGGGGLIWAALAAAVAVPLALLCRKANGKWNKLCAAGFLGFGLFVCGESLGAYAGFAHDVLLERTPAFWLLIPLFVLTFWVVQSGEMVRFGRLCLRVFAVFALLFCIVPLAGGWDALRLNLDLSAGLQTTKTHFATLFGGVFLLVPILCDQNENRDSCAPVPNCPLSIVHCSLIGAAAFLLMQARNVLALGAHAYETLAYPSAMAANRVRLGETLQNLQALEAVSVLGAAVCRAAVALFAAHTGLRVLFPRAPKWVLFALGAAASGTLLAVHADVTPVLLAGWVVMPCLLWWAGRRA